MLRSIGFAAALLITAAQAQAGEVVSLGAESIELGRIHGVAYYSVEPDGYRIITTLADGETGAPVRFEATLTDHQKITISVPGEQGQPGEALVFLRAGNKVIVSGPHASDDKLAVSSD